MAQLSVPTSSALPPTQRIPATNPIVFRTLYKLSRASLLSLVLDWLDDANQSLCVPYLVDDVYAEEAEDLVYPGVQTLEELREIYEELQKRRGGKREVVDRIIEGDWRNGVTLFQLAMADVQYLYDHPTSQKWTALKVVRLGGEDNEAPSNEDQPNIPRFHPATFLQNLQREVLPDVKAHYNLDRPKDLPLLLLRIYVLESPYNTSLALQAPATTNASALDTSKTIYVAFPDGSPHIYVSLATTTGPAASASEGRSLRKLLLDGIPKAFSRPRERYSLQSTSLSARSLEALLARRGSTRTNAAAGGWAIYAETKKSDTPLNLQLPSPAASSDEKEPSIPQPTGMKRRREEHASVQKRRKLIAEGRFGPSAKADDGQGIERFDVRLEDAFPTLPLEGEAGEEEEQDEEDGPIPAPMTKPINRKGRRTTLLLELEKDSADEDDGTWRPDVRITLHGPHVFAGIRELVECGLVDGERMPGWMTGEEGVSVGVVRNGRIRGHKGSGL
jgi:central kinetochore subunit Mis15/CHL4